ncbi:TonB-dependent siderophore receptor [Steroidobacter sp.]|uniref:TonB-dependent siderophore receptor n=1 Tax=Steroidobacter sp. TaxID=1978227 RepID=UPI001A6306A5|nr:TonB-dependent receptor [Steroidobacter sp.]MBL8268300.1 TonB-dependent receptor [Steroidobacter sp.]
MKNRSMAIWASSLSLSVVLFEPVLAQNVAASTDGEQLEEVVVEGAFLESGASSAMKLDVAVMDTPFSVSAYSEAFMSSIESANVADLYRYMTGIQKAGGSAYDLTIRGFKTDVNDRNAIMIDGLPGLSGRYGSPPTIGTERIEVVKGPASVLYGQAQPGGFVNLITKKPEDVASTEFLAKAITFAGKDRSFGSANGYSFAVDSTGPIDDAGKYLYRFIAERSEDLNSWRDDTFATSTYVAPSLTWQITDDTSLTVQGEYRESHSPYDRGLVAPNKNLTLRAPRTTRYQEPNDSQDEEGKTLSFSLQHRFANDMKWSFSGRRTETEDITRGMDNVTIRANGQSLGRRVTWLSNWRTSTFFDTNLALPFETGGIVHKMIVGIGGGYDTAELVRDRFFTAPASGAQSLDISIYNPVHGIYPDPRNLPLGTLTNRYNETSALGFYVADLMTLSEKWKLNLGARYSNEDQEITNQLNPADREKKKSQKTLPMIGLLYQPTPDWTLYTSYSTSFVPAPASVQDVNGNNPFKPEFATQVEVGVKADLFGGMMQPTLSIFSIDKEDVVTGFSCPPDVPATGTCSLQIGGQTSEGVEFEINARPLDNLQLVAGVARFDAKVSESLDPTQVNARVQNSARDNLHLWARYDFLGALEGLGASLGVSYTGERAGNLPTAADPRLMTLPSYTIVDVGVYYTISRYNFALRVSNLLDEEFIESTGVIPEVQLQMGAPRQLALTLRASF